MSDDSIGTAPRGTPSGQIAVSPNNPCPFLRALVANGYVGGHIVPLGALTAEPTVEPFVVRAVGVVRFAPSLLPLDPWVPDRVPAGWP